MIELVIVIVLLGITAVGMSRIFTGTVSGYLDTAARQERSALARIVLDRLTRELREALPESVRVSGRCLQYLPVVTSTSYVSLPPAATSITTTGFDIEPPAGNYYLAIHAINAGELYNRVALQALDGLGTSAGDGTRALPLTTAHSYPRTAPGARAYLVSDPISVCLLPSGELRRYVSPLAVAQPSPGAGLSGGVLLADGLDGASAEPTYSYTLGTTRANALITVNLRFLQSGPAGGENLAVNHEIRLRNAQ